MKCQELLGALNEYLDGKTQSALCQELQKHLADCTACQIVIDNIRQTITLYRAGRAIPLPAGFHEKIRLNMQKRWAEKFLPAVPRDNSESFCTPS